VEKDEAEYEIGERASPADMLNGRSFPPEEGEDLLEVMARLDLLAEEVFLLDTRVHVLNGLG